MSGKYSQGTSTGNHRFNLHDPKPQVVQKECERCGEEYYDLKALADTGRDICPDCSNPDVDLDLNRINGIGCAHYRPLMEHGPMSFPKGGVR